VADLRLVFDTNVLVSSLLLAGSKPFQALEQAEQIGILLFSPGTFSELTAVLSRRKFDRYLPLDVRIEFVEALRREGEWVVIHERVTACRDSKDDLFLEVAVNGRADTIVTGDADLLALNPFRGIVILTPDAFLVRFQT